MNVLSWTKSYYDADVRLIDPYGNQVFGPANFQDVAATTLTYTGTYTLLIEGRTFEPAPGAYSFRLDQVLDRTVSLTLGTNPAPSPYWTAGKLGGGLELTGADAVSVADTAALDLTNNVTLQAWIKVDQMPSSWAPIFYKGTGAADATGRTYSLWLNGAGFVYLGTSDAAGLEYIQTASGLVTPGQWLHVTGVIDRANGAMHIYINGMDVADGAVRAQLASASSNPLLIGSTQEVVGGYSDFQGTVDDARVWSIALGAAQIAAQYAAPLTGTEAGLALYLKLDDGAGTRAADSSPTGAIATLTSYNAQGITGQIASPGQQVHYTFNVTTAGQYYFDSLIDIPAFDWTLTGPQGTLVTARSFTQSDATRGNPLLSLVPGAYVLTVGATGATTGFYNFRLLPLSGAQPLTPGTPATITLNPGNSTQALSFSATAGERVYFDQTALSGSLYVRVIDPLGRDLYGAIYAGSLPSFGVQTLALAGTYTVLVEGDAYYDPALATISLNVQPVVDKAATLSLGTAVSGTIDQAGQAAAYTFTVGAPTVAYFDSLSNIGATWSLTGPSGAVVTSRSFQQSDSYDQASAALPLGAGAYTLTVRFNNDGTGAYSFNLQDLAAAAALTPGVPITDTAPAAVTKLYAFSGSAGDRVQLAASGVSGNASWRLIGPGGIQLFGPQNLTSAPNILTLPVSGAYVLAIENRIYSTTPVSYTIEAVTVAQAPANGATAQTFDTTGLPYVATQYGSAPAAVVIAGGPTGAFLRLAGGANTYQTNVVDFSTAGAGPFATQTVSYDARITPGANRVAGTGIGAALLSVSGFGAGGPSVSFGAIPSLAGALGVGLTLGGATDGSQDQVTLTYNGVQIVQVASGTPLGSGAFIHVQISVQQTDGGALVSVSLTPSGGAAATVINGVFVGGLVPDSFRAAFSGQTFYYPQTSLDIDNVAVTTTPATVTTPVLALDTAVSGTIARAGAVERYQFTLTTPITALFDALSTDNAIQWSLVGPNGAVVAARAFGSSDGVDLGSSPALALAAGQYTLSISRPNGSTGAFGFKLDNLASAAAITPGSAVTGTLNPGDVTVPYTFTAAAGDRYSVAGLTGWNGTQYYQVLDPSGRQVLASTPLYQPATFTATVAGAYTLLVEGRYNASSNSSYGLTLSHLTDKSAALTLNTVTTGSLDIGGQRVTYSFSLAAPTQLYFDSLTNDGDLTWVLTGPDGAQYASQAFNANDFGAIVAPAGAYTLVVSNPNNDAHTGPFSFRILDLQTAATAIMLGTPVSGTLDQVAGAKAYSFTATSGSKLYFDETARTNNLSWQLVGPYGANVFGTVGFGPQGLVPLAATGTYTLLIQGYVSNTGTATYTFNVQPAATSTAALALGAATSGTIATAGASQAYTFTLAAPTRVVLSALTDALDSGYAYSTSLSYTLTGASGVVATGALNRADGSLFGSTGSPAVSLAAGAYTLTLAATTDATGTYSFRLTDLASAAPLTLGTPVSGTLTPGSDLRAYKFTANAGDRIFAQETSYSGGSLIWRLLDPNNLPVFYSGFSGSSGAFNLPVAGTYTLLLEGSLNDAATAASTYGFTLFASPLSQPIPINTGGGVQAPDLVVSGLAASGGAQVQSGGQLTVTWMDSNAGNAPTDAGWTDRVIVSRVDNGAILANVTVPYTGAAIAGGGGQARQALVQLPDGNAGAGALTVTVTTDAGNTVSEQNASGTAFTNNTSTLSITSALAPYADLQVSGVALSPASGFAPGDTVTVGWTLANAGNAAVSVPFAEQITIRNTLTNQVIELLSDTVAASTTVPFAPGTSMARTATFAWPAGYASTGAFEVDVTADSTGVVLEAVPPASRTDNQASTTVLSAPDLAVTDAAILNAAALQSGDTVNIAWTDRNLGNAATPVSWSDRVRVVNTTTGAMLIDQAIDAGGVLGVGMQRARSFSFKLPDGTAGTGALTIAIIANQNLSGAAAVLEDTASGNPLTNNVVMLNTSSTLLVYPDLTTTAAVPATGQGGSPLTVGWTVTNRGAGATRAGTWTDRVVLSTTAALGAASDVVLGTFTHTGDLAPGASYTQSQALTLPAGLQGTYYITVVADAGLAVLEPDTRADATSAASAVTIASGYADFVTSAVSAPASASAGGSIQVGWTVTNSGTQATNVTSWTDRVYLSSGTTVQPGDPQIGSLLHLGALAVGASYTGSLSAVLPASANGTYHVLVRADADGAVYQNGLTANDTASSAPVVVGSPDLQVQSVTAPAAVQPGQVQTIQWTITNAGLGAAGGSWTDAVLISADGTLAHATAIGYATHTGGLAAGGAYTASVQAAIPVLADGPATFFVVADNGRQVFEANGETDNTGSATTAVTHPDLAVASVSAPASATAGGTASISWTVSNTGSAAIPGHWTDQVYLVSGTTLDGSQQFLGAVQESGPLAAGAQYTGQLQVTLPTNVTPGAFHVLVLTNSGGDVNEAGHTANNTAASAAIAVAQTPLPDLQVSGLTVTPGAGIQSGALLTVAWSALNAGMGPATGSFYSHVVVVNTTTGQTVSDQQVYYDASVLGPIAANGGTAPLSAAVKLPDGVAGVGALSITVTADSYNQVFEGAGPKTDNSASITRSSVLSPYADLTVDGLAVNPAAPNSGSTLAITWTTTNHGTAPVTAAFVDEVQVINQTTGVTVADVFVPYDPASAGPINAGAGVLRQASVTLPDGTAGVGAILVRVTADSRLQVPELVNAGRTDNTATQTLTATLAAYPDLVVSNITVPAGAPAGGTITVSYTVTNQGTGTAAGTWADAITLSSDGTAATDRPLQSVSESGQSLAPGASATFSATITLPPTADGPQYVAVTADALHSLVELDHVSHRGISAALLTIMPGLTLALGEATLANTAGSAAFSATVTRSGSMANAVTVALAASQPGLVLPATVTIAAGQAAAAFLVGAVNSGVTGPTLNIAVTASAAGYTAGTASLMETNANTPMLSVMGPASVNRNAGTVSVMLERNTPIDQPLTVSLSSDLTFFMAPPATATFAAGQNMLTLDVPLVDDGFVYGNRNVHLTAAAPGFTTASTQILVFDTDIPALTLALGQSSISEAAGANATTLTVTRSVVTSQALNVSVGTMPGQLRIGSSFQIAAGAASVVIPVGVVDLGMPTSDVMAVGITVTAADPDFGNPIRGTAVQTELNVTGSEGPTLGVSLAAATITGGATTAGTVTRADGDTAQALTVLLSSSNPQEATVPGSVVIAAGQTSASFIVTGLNDGALNSTSHVTIGATAAAWASGYQGLTVSNQNLPNLAVSSIVNPSSLISGTGGTVTYTVTNTGRNDATGPWLDRVYLSNDAVLNNDAVLIGTPQIASLAAGQSYTQSLAFTTGAPGTYFIIVVSDSGNVVQTINAGDKQRTGGTAVTVTPAYTATVQALTHVAPAGTAIALTGTATDAVTNLPDAAVQVAITITNNGFVRTLQAFTDSSGNFRINFKPLGTESGTYTISAAQPGAAPPASQDSFTLLGLKASASGVTLTGLPGQTVQGSFTITNTTGVALTGLTARLSAGLPATATLSIAPIGDLAGNGTETVNYSFSSSAPITGGASLTITSAEGAKLTLPLTVSVLPLTPNLVTDPGYLQAGMVVGTQSQVSFKITNTGGAESGPLTVTLPSAPWLTLQSPASIASIASGGTAKVTLQLTPDQALALQEYKGSIVIAGADTSVTVPFNFRAVSTAVGDVTVAVQDEYTFFAEGKPLLAGATVTLTDPYSYNVVASAVTDASGMVSFSGVAAGGYLMLITAPQHATLQASVTVVPGITNSFTEFVHRQAVSYTWTVVPTTVNDSYKIELQSTFQTAVPMPVVTVDKPLIMPLVLAGQTTTVEVTFTNHGLIDATHLQIQVPTDPDFIITPLVSDIGTLPAMSSITIPISIRFNPTSPLLQGAATSAGEVAPQGAAGYAAAIAKCLGLTALYDYVCVNAQWVQVPITMDTIGCLDNAAGAAGAIKGVLTNPLKPGDLLGAGCSVLDAAISCLTANNNWSAGANAFADCAQAILITACGAAAGAKAGGVPGAILGGLSSGGSDILTCLCDIGKLLGGIDSGTTDIDGGDFGPGGGGYGGNPDFPYLVPVGYDVPVTPCGPATMSAGTLGTSSASSDGAAAPSDMSMADQGVCATVRLQISQQAVVTRTAFDGTLDIMNGMAGVDLTNLSVTLDIRDMMGNAANGMFSIHAPTVSGLSGPANAWTLVGGTDGSLEYIFLPTVDAAVTEPMMYTIGGTLHYVQDGVAVDVPLAAAVITVYPEAKLNLNYFWQRDVIGDDPFTPQVEPSEPFYLALRATNVGAGNAANLTITSAQPKIIENEKGLLIDFQITGSQVENAPGTGSLTVDLGLIKPGQTVTADWALLSSLQGRFTDFSASFTHEDDGGSLRTSLINSVTIHELIHVVHLGAAVDNGVASLLVNDVPDPGHTPDTLYIGDGGQAPVTSITDAQWAPAAGGAETLTSEASTGWSYISIADPAPGLKLLSVMRSDGKVLAIDGTVWRTDRSFPAGSPGANDENLIHLLDYNSTGSYTFIFINDDGKAPHITALQDLSTSVLAAAVPSLDVTFSKPIDPATLTAQAVSLTLNGVPVLLSGLAFTDQGGVAGGGETYRIGGLAAFTGGNGNYTLTVDGTKVSDLARVMGDNAVSTSFTVSNGVAVLMNLSPVTPNIRNTPVGTIDVAFSAPINAATFTPGALTLTRDGAAVLLGSGVTIVQLTPSTFRIGGLGAVAAADGAYALTVNAALITDTHGAAAAGLLTDMWTEDTTSPQVLAIEQIATNPRNTIVPSLVVTLSKAIDPASFDYHAVTVTQNGGPNLVTATTTVTRIDDTHYRLAGFNNAFSAVTGIDGTYTITVNGAGLRDLAGNAGGGTVSESWVLDVVAPAAATSLAITPDRGVSATDGITNTLAFSVVGNVTDPTVAVRLTDLTTHTELGYATVTGTSFAGAVALTTPGQHQIRVRVVDTAGNIADQTISVFIDLAPPSATALSAISPDPRTTPVDSVDVTISKDLAPGVFTTDAVSLTRDGVAVPLTSGVNISSLGADMWRIAGLSAFDAAPGMYDLTVNAAGLSDIAGNSGTGTLDEMWTVVAAGSTGGLSGTVYRDTTGTGMRTTATSDPGLVGWTVFIDAAGTGVLAAGDPATTTAADGSYSFTGLAPGLYTVSVVPKTGYVATGAASATLTVIAGQTRTTGADFGEFQLGTLSGVVFDDANADGQQSAGETGLAGVTVFLDPTGDGVLRPADPTMVTDAQGRFSFTGVGPGTVRLGEVLPAGDARTTAPTPIAVISGTTTTTLAIGNAALGSIAGTLYDDTNGDAAREAGEPGLAGWTVFIDSNHDGLLEAGETTTTTDGNGAYSFTGLLPGSYSIGEVLKPGYVETSPVATAATSGAAVTPSGSDVAIHVDGSWTGPGGQNYGALANADAAALTQLTAARLQSAFAGLEGQGQTTVVIDTGIDNSSPFFGPETLTLGIADRIVYEYDFADGTPLAVDTSGHGSNVASVIASSDAAYPGVAPDANLIVLKVFDASGNGTFGYVAQALTWVAANAAKYHIGVVNMSLGDGGDWTNSLSRYGLGPVLAQLQAEDVITVAAAGNNYATSNGLGVAYPGSDPAVVAVGSVWAGDFGGPYSYSDGGTDYTTGADHIAAYSQRDPNLLDTLAPGSALTGANATGGASTYQGTSQASAYVAGAATLVQQLATQVLGRQLSTAEFINLLRASGDLVTDGSQNDDSVQNTGLSFPRLDFVKLFDAVQALAGGTGAAGGGNTGGGSGSGPVVTAGAASGFVNVALTEGAHATGVDFGDFKQGTISGTVFADANRNGVQDGGEAGVSGVTVFLDEAGTGAPVAADPVTTTDALGHYSFSGVGPGRFPVRAVLPANQAATSPDPLSVTMTSGLAATANFGLGGTASAITLSASGPATATIGQPYTITLSETDPGHTVSEWFIDWGDGTIQGIAGDPTSATHTYARGAATFTVAASAMDDTGIYDAAPFSVTVGAPLQVVSVTPNASGVAVRFNHAIDPTTLHLYDTAATPLGAPDVTLVGVQAGAVAGSLVFDSDLMGFTFIATGGPLAADSYTLTMLSGAGAFHDAIGALDGADTGAPGSADATASFTTAAPGATLSLPDFVRAPGQGVDYAVGGHGVPLTVTNAAGLSALTFHVDYDPSMLTITGVVPGSVPAGSTLTATVTSPGHAVFVFTGAGPLGAGAVTIGAIAASVPAGALYGERQVLRVGIDSAAGATVTGDNALEVVGLLGDTDGNGGYDANDAALVQRVIVKSDRGFGAWPDVDPVILADVARHGSLVTIDATRIAQEAVSHARPEFPTPPATPFPVNPAVLQSGLPPAAVAAALLASEDSGLLQLATAGAFGLGDDADAVRPKTDPMRIKLAQTFADFSLSGAAGNAPWKGDFVTALGAASRQATPLRVML